MSRNASSKEPSVKERPGRSLRRLAARWGLSASSLLVLGGLATAWLLYPRPGQGPGGDREEIVYWVPADSWTDSMRVLLDEFERRNPGYRIARGTSSVRGGGPTRFLLSMAGGNPPDLIYFNRASVVQFASRGGFMDLKPLVERDLTEEPGAPDLIVQENYVPSSWHESEYRGGVYAVPNNVAARALLYNRDLLIRANLVYREDDPDVLAGRARAGEARAPTTWEEICRKRVHARGQASGDGIVTLSGGTAGDGAEAPPKDLAEAGVRAGDVAAMIRGTDVFRGRIAQVIDGTRFRIDLDREQPPGLRALPSAVTGDECEVKVFDQDSYAIRLTRFDLATGRVTSFGFAPLWGNSHHYLYALNNGADYITPDGTTARIDQGESVEALQWLVDVYDAMGGVKKSSVLLDPREEYSIQDPFLTGKLAMLVHGEWFLGAIMSQRPDMNFGAAPPPVPEAWQAAGHEAISWTGGRCYSIPSKARNPEGGWRLLRWLASPEALELSVQFSAGVSRARGRTYLPYTHPDIRLMAWQEQEYLGEDSAVPATLAQAYSVFKDLLMDSREPPKSAATDSLFTHIGRAVEATLNHAETPHQALEYASRQVQSELDEVLHPPEGPPVRWPMVIGTYAAFVLGFFIVLAAVQHIRERRTGSRHRWFEGYVCAAPWLVGFIVFGAGPIVFSVLISLCSYDVINPAQFIGFDNYIGLLGRHVDAATGETVWNDPLFWKSLANTLFMVISVPLGIMGGLGLALLLDSRVRGLHVYRTIYYLPAIVPAVATFVLWRIIFDPGRGMLNQVLFRLGVNEPPSWLQDPVWSKPSLIIMGLWAVGGSMIIWLAGLKDIPESLHEAAAIDGASRWHRFRHITVPLLTPYIFFNLIMGLIGVFQVFEAAFVMTEGGPADSTLFYAYKLFNEAFRQLDMGTASAMAWILFAIVLSITMVQLYLSKRWVYYSGD